MCTTKCLNCVIPVSVVTAAEINQVPYTERINNNKVTHIWVRTASGVQKDVNGNTLAASGVIKTAHLRLMSADGNEQWKIPIESLQRDTNYPEPFCVGNLDIDSSQCQIILDTGASGYSATAVIELLFGIVCPGKQCQ